MKNRNSLSSVAAFSFCVALIVALAPIAFAQRGGIIYQFNNRNGSNPTGGLVADAAGNLYGSTILGGKTGPNGLTSGTVYKLVPPANPNGEWKDDVLYAFTGGTDGQNPTGGVLLDAHAGKIFGLGSTNSGQAMVYQLSKGSPWTESVIYTFSGGGDPNPGLIADAQGSLYGTTQTGGEFTCNGGNVGCGSVYKLTPPAEAGGVWTQQDLYNFQGGNDGWHTSGGLVFDKTGALYGVTFFGGPGNGGTVYKLTPPAGGNGNWTESVLYAFNGGPPEGGFPNGSLALDGKGNLYGTTSVFSTYNYGDVYELSPPAIQGDPWTENILYVFTGGTDGGDPQAGLSLDGAGNLYGTTLFGGDIKNEFCLDEDGGGSGCGTVFKVAPPAAPSGSWTESVLYPFPNLQGYPQCTLSLVGNYLYGITLRDYVSDQQGASGTAFKVEY